MTLSMAAPNQEVKILSIQGGTRMKKRLADLGLNPGMVVRVLTGNNYGALILAVKDSRLALGRGMAQRIIVEPIMTACA